MSDSAARASTTAPAATSVGDAPSPGTAPALPAPAVRTAQQAALAATLALIALGLAWELWLAPTGTGTLAIKVLPLALALPGLRRHRMYTFRWLSLLVWLYVLEGLLRATTERGTAALLATAEVALSLALFTAATFYIRRRLASASTTPATSASP